jgi:hypothetical protein
MKPCSRQIDGFFDIYKNRLDLELVHFACLVTGLRTLTPMVEPAGNFFIRLMCGWPPTCKSFS